MFYKFIQTGNAHIRNVDIPYFSMGGFADFPDVVLYPVVVIKLRFVSQGNNQYLPGPFGICYRIYFHFDGFIGLIHQVFKKIVGIFQRLSINGDNIIPFFHIDPWHCKWRTGRFVPVGSFNDFLHPEVAGSIFFKFST